MRLTQNIIRKMIKEALNAQEREDKINSIVRLLSNLDQGDLNYIMTTVRNEIDDQEDLGEKLDKDADAGDYVKDFQKSDAPQFKGKSKKKKKQMAIAAYLDAQDDK
jgi:RNA binding exosome subunit